MIYLKSMFVILTLMFSSVSFAQVGTASWYGLGDGFNGKRMANGQRFNTYGLVVAHRTLPFGTKVKVTNLKNKRSVLVTIGDRGPAARTGRIIDLSYAAKSAIGMGGTAPVSLEVVK